MKVVHGRPPEGIVTSMEPHKDINLSRQFVVEIASRETKVTKFGNRGGDGDGDRCHKNTGDQRVGDSDADDWQDRREAKDVRSKIAKIARNPHFNNNAEFIPVPVSPEKIQEEHLDIFDDHSNSLLVNWKEELVTPSETYWRDEILNAKPMEGKPSMLAKFTPPNQQGNCPEL